MVDALAAQKDLAMSGSWTPASSLIRLTCHAIGAQQRVDLALAEVQVDFADGERPAEALAPKTEKGSKAWSEPEAP